MILTHMTDINGIELIKGQSQTKCREQRECDFIFTSSKCPCYIGDRGRFRQRFSFNFPGFVYKQILIILGLYDSLSNFLSNHRFCFLKNASVFVFLTKEDLGGSGQGRGRSRQAVGQVETSMKRAGQVAT